MTPEGVDSVKLEGAMLLQIIENGLEIILFVNNGSTAIVTEIILSEQVPFFFGLTKYVEVPIVETIELDNIWIIISCALRFILRGIEYTTLISKKKILLF